MTIVVVTLANPGISGSEFAARFERHLEPKTREMQHAQRTGHTRTNERQQLLFIDDNSFSCVC